MITNTPTKEELMWKRPGAYKVFNLIKTGVPIDKISEETKWKIGTIWNFIRTPAFLQKLNDYFKCVYFEQQKNEILKDQERIKFLSGVMMGEKEVKGLSPAAAGRLLVKFKLQQEKQQPKIANPIQFDIISEGAVDKKEMTQEEIEKQFGYEGLKDLGNEEGELEEEIEEPEEKEYKPVREENEWRLGPSGEKSAAGEPVILAR